MSDRIGSFYPTRPQSFLVGKGLPHAVDVTWDRFTVIAGPCAIESRDHALYMANRLSDVCHKLGIQLIYKSCFDKDCRSSKDSFHGLGAEEGLSILQDVRSTFGIPVTSDFSEVSLAHQVGKVVDLLQVPAYLCRQTSMLRAAAETNKPVHVKKGQFMSPWNMKNTVRKLRSFGCSRSYLEREVRFMATAC